LLAVKLNSAREWQLFHFWPATGRVQDLPVVGVDPQDSLSNPRVFPDGKEALIDGAPLGKEAGGMRLLVVDLATGATRPLAPDVPRGTGAPDFAVSRDGKSALITLELGEFTRVLAVPTHGRGPAQTLFTTTHEVWSLDTAPDGSVYSCVTDVPAELVSRPLDRDQPETWAQFPEVSDPDLLAVLPDGRVVLTVLYSDRPRLMVVERGKKPVAMVATTEETSTPVTVAGPREIAFLIGPIPRATIAFADVETGRITRRIAPGKGEIVSLAASPDGGTLYFGTGGTIWSIPSAGGQARKIRAGDRVVADPSGRALLVTILESPNMRLFRVPLDGSPETEIAADASHAPRYSHLSPGSWNADGRLLVSLHETWFAAPAVLDTRNGHVQPLPFDKTSDYANMAWLPDGRMVALRISMRSTLWRFVPAQE
jgi:dipeptidyl aminopeptidase/acylaminoacyl peptidase